MPKTYNDVLAEYDQFKQLNPQTGLDLTSFAKAMDADEGAPNRAQAYDAPWYRRADAAVDRAFEATQVPEIAGYLGGRLGKTIDESTGTHIAPTLEGIGRDTPRMVAESLATVPEALSGVGLPAAIATWLNRGAKLAGYGGAALKGYAQTDSPVGAAIGAGQMYGANKLLLPAELGGMNVGGRATNAVTEALAPAGAEATTTAQRVLGPLVGFGTDVGATTALNEATRQAQMSVGPNAVGLTDESRNPLTQENIAGNVAGAAFFAPQLVEGLRHPQMLQRDFVQGLHQDVQARTDAENAAIETSKIPDTTQSELPLQSQDPLQRSRQEAAYGIIKSNLDAASIFDRDGNVADAERARTNALEAINRSAQGDFGPLAPEVTDKIKTAVDNEARLSTDARPEWLRGFTDQVKGIIDMMNEGRVNYEEAAAQKREELSPREFQKWEAEQQKTKGESWHPGARAAEAVDRVWSSGTLQPLTPEWLASEFNATVDAGGNPQFATRVVAQKVANYMSDRLPSAIAQDVASRKAVTEPSKGVQKLTALDQDFARSISSLPPQIREAVIRRTVEIQRHGNFTPGQAESLGVSEGTRIDRRTGRPVTPYPTWQRAVIQAARTFDPQTRMISLPRGGVDRAVPYTTLVEKSPNGRYVWEPHETDVPMAAGGKSFAGGSVERNIEALPTRGAQESVGALDEEAAKAAYAEGGTGTELARTPDEAFAAGENAEPTDVKLGLTDEKMSASEGSAQQKLAKGRDTILKNLKTLSDDQLWSIAKDQFVQARGQKPLEQTKKPLLREKLMEFLSTGKIPNDTRRFFQFENAVSGGTGVPHVDRATAILRKLADPATVERAKQEFKLQKGAAQETPVDAGTLENPPSPGTFAQDVHRTLRETIDTAFGRKGYSGSTRDFLTEVAVALARQQPGFDLDFYRLQGTDQGRLAIKGGPGGDRSSLGLNVDYPIKPSDERKAMIGLLQTLQHEITHMDGYIRDGLLPKPDAYSDERKRVFDNMMHLAENLTPEERAAMLEQVRSYVPKKLQENLQEKDGRPYGTSNPEEMVAQMTGHVVNMLMFDSPQGRAAANEMLDFAPQEVREFARNTFGTVHDVMDSMRQAVHEGDVLVGEMNPFITTKGFDALVDSARVMTELRYVDRALADARGFMATADGAPFPGMTQSMWVTKGGTPFKAQASMPERTSETALEGFQQAADYVGPRALDKAARPNLVTRFLAPFRNLMWSMEKDGNKTARPIADAIFGLEGGSNRLQSNILSDFMKRNPDGSMKYDQDNALIQRIQKEPTGRWRDEGLNKVRAWQQEVQTMADGKTRMDAQPMFVQDPKTGEITTNPGVKGADAVWARIKSQLSRADQDLVMNASVAMDRVGQRSKDVILQQIKESNTNRAAVLLMAVNRKMPTDQALAIANAAHEAFLSGNVLSLRGTIPPEQIEMMQRLFLGTDGKSGLIGNLMKVGEHFDNRPGYSSEQLPHDWIVRYRNAQDEVKFDSRPTESQAKALAQSLVKSGNRIDGEIVNRRDANALTRIDAPVDVLAKISEQENFQWEKFVSDLETQHGLEIGIALRQGYTPLETTVSRQATQGVGKFLAERKGFVDRSKFDYLDATLASAQRLAYSVATRSMRERVELYLNDPSVRLMPSFQNLVKGHVTEMLRPQNEVLGQMKGIVSGYYIGANLGSAVTNAMQSLQTLVPTLDSLNPTGSFAKPWKQLSVAIKDATDMTLSKDWQEVAARAKTKDPSKWTEDETVAALWSRQNESGGFSHTVVDDLVYGSDQRLLANAKFGRGDYGPVSKASMLRSGMYLLNQFAMKPFRWVEHGNAKVAFLAGVRQAYEQGLRGDAAYSHANQVQGLATFGGGRANASGLQTALSKGFTPGGAGLALALQQYGFGVVAMHAQFVKDAIGRSDMTPAEKFHARRAYGSMLMTQVALAGTLGLPLVGATLTALEKIFGVPANQAVRNGLAGLSTGPDGEPDETGQTIAEVGLNGFLDYYTGLDASSRLGTSTLLGTSSYKGFSWGDLAGPVAGMLENGVKSLNYFATGNPMQAASALAPQALKNAILMTDMQKKYGDSGFRDASGNLLYTPTPTESALYTLGIRPRELSRKRQMSTALQTANDLATQANDRDLDTAAEELVQGDPTRARRLAFDRQASDPTQRYQDVLRQVMDRAVGSQVEKDLLATGSRLNEAERQHIVKTFGADVNNRRSEVDMQRLRLQMAQMLGDPTVVPTAESFQQAVMVDALVQRQGMPRSQAVRLVEFLRL